MWRWGRWIVWVLGGGVSTLLVGEERERYREGWRGYLFLLDDVFGRRFSMYPAREYWINTKSHMVSETGKIASWGSCPEVLKIRRWSS
jgi:hypothetical protein